MRQRGDVQVGGRDEVIRVLIVDDSASVREMLLRLLRADPQFEVVGTASEGEEAVTLTARLRPDVITMDIHMSGLDGVAATQQIMSATPTPIVVLSASIETKEVGLAFEALRAGAVAVLDKPPGPGHPGYAMATERLLSTLRIMSEVQVVRRRVPSKAGAVFPGGPASPARSSAPRPAAVLLAASTGGPPAIQTVLQTLGADLEIPILVVQHMSPGFIAGMANWLAETCPQRVRLATAGETPVGGTVYLAPDDHHLLLTRRATMTLSKAPPVGGFRPSADVLFQSGAECYGARAVGVILTGMGDDGAAGLGALRAAGAATIAQDEVTSIVYGMPRVAAESGAAGQVLPLSAIGPAILELVNWREPSG